MPTAPLPSRTPRTLALALLLAGSGCAQPLGPVPEPFAAAPAAAVQPPWWTRTGDPTLEALVREGLAADAPAQCEFAALREADRAAAAKTVGATLKRLFAQGAETRALAARQAALAHAANSRAARAQRIALAYLEVRRLQQIGMQRDELVRQYRDNAEIAEFRREAGLVPAIDGALARAQEEAVLAELGRTHGRLEEATAALAKLTGSDPAALASRLSTAGELVPPPGGAGPAPAAGQAQGNVPFPPSGARDASAAERETRLLDAREAARHAVRDARLAYREGAGSFATLYVAEAAALAVETALADVRAERFAAAIRQWGSQDRAWARADVERLMGEPAMETVACD